MASRSRLYDRYDPNEEAMKHDLARGAANGGSGLGSPMPEPPQLRCGTCEHWLAKPTDAASLGERRGLCIAGPPSVTALQVRDRFGTVATTTVSAYPDVPSDFVACHQHKARIALEVAG